MQVEIVKKELNASIIKKWHKLPSDSFHERRNDFASWRYINFTNIVNNKRYDYFHKNREITIIFWIFLDYLLKNDDDFKDFYLCDSFRPHDKHIENYALYIYHKPFKSLNLEEKAKLENIFNAKFRPREPLLFNIFELSYYLYGKNINHLNNDELNSLFRHISKEKNVLYLLVHSSCKHISKEKFGKSFEELSEAEMKSVIELSNKNSPVLNQFIQLDENRSVIKYE
jgi:hypothetical protein